MSLSSAAVLSIPPSHPLYPLYVNNSHVSDADVAQWHRSVLPHHPPTPLHPYVVFILIAAAFFLFFRCLRWMHSRMAGSSSSSSFLSPYLQLYASFSPLQQREWDSYIVSTVHAALACIAGFITVSDSLSAFQEQYLQAIKLPAGLLVPPPPPSSPLSFFLHTSLHPVLSVLSPSSVPSPASDFAPSTASFHLALSCTFSESYLRDCMLMITCGYLLFDLCLCLHTLALTWRAASASASPAPSSLVSPLTIVHHVLILLAFVWGLHSHIGTLYSSAFLINEGSTLFLNANFFLAASSLSLSLPRLYRCNALLLLLSFVLLRAVLNSLLLLHLLLLSWLALHSLYAPSAAHSRFLVPSEVTAQCALLTLLAAGHVLINYAWLVMLLRAVSRKWKKTSGGAAQADAEDGEKKTALLDGQRQQGQHKKIQ